MADPSFDEQWNTAVQLTEVRGWKLSIDRDGAAHVQVANFFGQYVFPKDEDGLVALVHKLSQADDEPDSNAKYKAKARYSFGFTDPRGIYATTTS